MSFSRIGKRHGEDSAAFQTHRAHYASAKKLCNVMIIENVPEYKAEIIERELGKQWSIKHCIIDPRVLGVPACRTRLYAIAWKHAEVNWRNDLIMEDVIEVLTSRVVGNAGAFFWDDLPKTQLRPAQDF